MSAIDEGTTLAGWLLERGIDGLGLTKTHALQRAVVREVAERWPRWWRHELFGPPHRETDLPVLHETHAALRRLRLVRRRHETLLTTARGRELLADPEALLRVLHEDLQHDGFDGDAWLLIEETLHERGPLEREPLTEIVGRWLMAEGWREAGGAPLEGWALSGALWPTLRRAEAYGFLRHDGTTLELTEAGHRLAATEPEVAAPGDLALIFDAQLLNVKGVRARVAVLERQHLTALHDTIQEAFGWFDDHLYSFWLDGRFWGEQEVTSPVVPDEAERTADLPIAELDLCVGQKLAYVFDFGDEWRVRLTVRERVAAAGDYPRVIEVRGTPPPQYA
ncbi:MAG TPA: hypothetical protein VFZ00_05120 [Solirubrobacter sp.]|nr:hypothetical protein [Solirubrobacter sp.]